MAAIDFPSSPTVGQTYSSGTRTWVYTSAGYWKQTNVSGIPEASATQGGIVNTTSQTFAGDKTFVGSITVNGITYAYTPAGMISQFAGATAPTGWTICDGAAISRTTYATLFAVIGTTYGAGDGSTTFNIPNLQNRIPVGKGSGTFAALNAQGGSETVALTAAQLPSHTHSGTTGDQSQDHSHSGWTSGVNANHVHSSITSYNPYGIAGFGAAWGGVDGYPRSADGSYSIAHNTGFQSADHAHYITTGGASQGHTHAFTTNGGSGLNGEAHSNLQPYIVLNYIIKT